ncbi:MAG: cache domain-containing protein [Allosphingosinicella sp.]
MSTFGWLRQRWFSLFVIVAGGLLLAFLIWMIYDSSQRNNAADRRNVADLAILTDGLEQWPRAIAALGDNNVYQVPGAAVEKRGARVLKTLYHPAFHEYQISYVTARQCSVERTITRGADGSGPVLLKISGATNLTSPTAPLLEGLDRRSGPICYSVALPLEPMLRVRDVASSFSHLLIVNGAGGDIVAQLGGDPLPLKNVDNLPKLKNALLTALQRSLPGSGAAAGQSDEKGVLEPIDTEIAGTAYRLYQRPFSLGGGAAAGQAIAPDSYMAVGVVPYERVQASSLRVSKDTVTGFALAFALLLALLPIIKLRLLGPVDDLTKLETGAVILGLCVATWVATMAVGYSLLLVHGRAVADARAQSTARLMAEDIGNEIAGVLTDDHRSRLRSMIGTLYRPETSPAAVPPRPGEKNVRPFRVECGGGDCRGIIPQPDTVVLTDAAGGQLEGTPIATYRADAGAYSKVGERNYFQRALHREFPAGRSLSLNIPCLEQKFAAEQVRSLPDGIARTILAVPVSETYGKEACRAPGATGKPAVAVAAMVLRSLVSPLLRRDIEFMIVDRQDPRLRTLFHSVESRALVESLDEHSKGPGLRAAIARLSLDNQEMASFTTDYDGEQHMFAASRIPNTSWAVLTHVNRRRVDERSADVALGALWLAVALASLAGLLLIFCWLAAHNRLWQWLWPNAHYVNAYRALTKPMAALAALSALIMLAAWMLPAMLVPLRVYIVVVVVIPLIALIWLWVRLGRGKGSVWARRRLSLPEPDCCQDRRLTAEAERSYLALVVTLLLILMALPAGAQLYDAAVFVSQAEGQSEGNWLDLRRIERDRRLLGIARTYFRELRRSSLPTPPCPANQRGGYVLKEEISNVPTMLGFERRFAFRRNEPRPTALPCQREDSRAMIGTPLAAYLLVLLLAFAFSVLIWKAVRGTLRGLFGFGIALEAVEQPRHPEDDWDWDKAPPQTLIVGASMDAQAKVREDSDPKSTVRVIDLVAETDAELPRTSIKKIPANERVVLENLELLLRDPLRRYRALRFLELLVAKQRRQASIKVVVLTDLSPLERLLQRFERDSEVLESASTPEAHKQLEDIKRNREDVRWSRLFASFATFSHRRTSDRVPDRAAELLIACRGQAENDPLNEAQRKKIAERVLKELAPLPAHVIRCGLPYLADDVWQVQFRAALELNAVSPRAVVDHFASVFIEHYQLIWSASSLAERLIMYHLAHGRVVNIERAYAVRTLVRRGIVVLDPVPRLFNRSFAQFVRNVEKPETLQRWRRDAPSGAWAKAQLPMLLLIPTGLIVLLVLVKQSGQSALALAPILVTAAPALLQALGVLRRPGSA